MFVLIFHRIYKENLFDLIFLAIIKKAKDKPTISKRSKKSSMGTGSVTTSLGGDLDPVSTT